MNTTPSKKGLYASIAGTIVVALCCFTPLLVVAVGLLGVGFLTPYLDYVLYPALGLMLVLTVLSYRKYKKGCTSCSNKATADTEDNSSHT